jgi:hypothetical protein
MSSDIFHPRWAEMHRDAEMSFIIQSTISDLPKKLSFRVFSEALQDIFTSVLHDREPASADLFKASDLSSVSSKVFGAKGTTDWFFEVPRETSANTLVAAWLVYVHSLLLGAPSPREEHDTYWPFGNEGGFCNPMKLKMMDD